MKLDRLEFLKLYNQKLNDSEIAKILGVNNATVTIHRNNLKLEKNFKYVTTVNEVDFILLYNKGLSDNEISKILGYKQKQVTYLREKLKLGRSYKKIELEQFNRNALIGSLLGDGHLRIDNINAYGDFAHSLQQKEYAFHKYNLFKELCAEPSEQVNIDKRNGKEYFRIHVRFLSNPYLTEIFNNLYSPITKKKIISLELLKDFNEISLAYLFMDDGYKTTNGYCISTNDFDLQSIINLKNHLLNEFKIESSIFSNKVIYIKAESKQLFKNLISMYVLNSLKYKM